MVASHGGSGRSKESIARRRRERISPRKPAAPKQFSGQDDSSDLARQLWSAHKLRMDDARQMLARQGGRCAVCRTPIEFGRNLNVDHDHGCCPVGRSCGKCIRGLLCRTCNTGLGKFKDDPAMLMAAHDYLSGYVQRVNAQSA